MVFYSYSSRLYLLHREDLGRGNIGEEFHSNHWVPGQMPYRFHLQCERVESGVKHEESINGDAKPDSQNLRQRVTGAGTILLAVHHNQVLQCYDRLKRLINRARSFLIHHLHTVVPSALGNH